MNILIIGLDNSIAKNDSQLAARAVELSRLVDLYYILVPGKKSLERCLSEKAEVIQIGGANKAVSFFRIYLKAKKIIKTKNINLISIQDQYYLAFVGWMLAKKFKIGLELQIHGFEKFFGLRKWLAKFIMPRASVVRCVSRRLKKQLVDDFKVNEEKITVVPIFVDLRIQNSDLRIKRESNKIIFLTVGRLVPVKNIAMQIKAMSEIAKKYKNVELWISGEGGEREKLESIIKSCGLEKNVKLLGWQDNLNKFYEQADIFLLTSDAEGWGLAAIEAASRGLPIIMTDVGCAGEVFVNNESGIIIPVGDQKALEQAMVSMIEDQGLRNKLGENAKKAVLGLPSREETYRLYKESWNKAISR